MKGSRHESAFSARQEKGPRIPRVGRCRNCAAIAQNGMLELI